MIIQFSIPYLIFSILSLVRLHVGLGFGWDTKSFNITPNVQNLTAEVSSLKRKFEEDSRDLAVERRLNEILKSDEDTLLLPKISLSLFSTARWRGFYSFSLFKLFTSAVKFCTFCTCFRGSRFLLKFNWSVIFRIRISFNSFTGFVNFCTFWWIFFPAGSLRIASHSPANKYEIFASSNNGPFILEQVAILNLISMNSFHLHSQWSSEGHRLIRSVEHLELHPHHLSHKIYGRFID